MVQIDPEFAKVLPGIGGSLMAAMTKIKDGVRIVVTQFIMGAIPIWVLNPIWDWVSKKTEVPTELIGFAAGLLAVAVALKAIETVMMLDFAKPFNAAIERWTGAKAPPTEGK